MTRRILDLLRTIFLDPSRHHPPAPPFDPSSDPHWMALDQEQRASEIETARLMTEIRDWRDISIQERMGAGQHDRRSS